MCKGCVEYKCHTCEWNTEYYKILTKEEKKNF